MVDLDDVVVVGVVELESLGVADICCGFVGEDGNVYCGISVCCIVGDGMCGRQPFGCQSVGFWPFDPLWLWFQGSPWLGVPSLRHGKGNRTFVVVGLGLCPCLWCYRCGLVATEGIQDDEWCPQSAADWRWCAPGTGYRFAGLSAVARASPMSCWTIECPWDFAVTRFFFGGALQIGHSFRTADIALASFWVGHLCSDCI
jgi:hypothetical protein